MPVVEKRIEPMVLFEMEVVVVVGSVKIPEKREPVVVEVRLIEPVPVPLPIVLPEVVPMLALPLVR